MSFVTSTPKKKGSAPVSFIPTNNPEVLTVLPRAGGAVRIPVNASSFHSAASGILKEQISREFKVQTALEETGSVESVVEPTLPNPLKDAMFMFGVTVSSLILMASGHAAMTDEYASWTKLCLETVRDDFGNHPPNVQGILNHLKYLKDSGQGGGTGVSEEKASPEPVNEGDKEEGGGNEDEEVDENGEKTVVTKTTLKIGSAEQV